MGDIPLHIMIIDDNSSIHMDFIKVLTSSDARAELAYFEQQLFDDPLLNESENADMERFLPKFIFNTAYQGQEAIKK